MNTKQKYNRIDQSKLDSKQVEILKIISQKTNDFKTKDKELLGKIDVALDKIISALEEKNPNKSNSIGQSNLMTFHVIQKNNINLTNS